MVNKVAASQYIIHSNSRAGRGALRTVAAAIVDAPICADSKLLVDAFWAPRRVFTLETSGVTYIPQQYCLIMQLGHVTHK